MGNKKVALLQNVIMMKKVTWITKKFSTLITIYIL